MNEEKRNEDSSSVVPANASASWKQLCEELYTDVDRATGIPSRGEEVSIGDARVLRALMMAAYNR